MLRVGSNVICSGLVGRADLNGSIGVITSYSNEQQRWIIMVDGEPKKLAMKELAGARRLVPPRAACRCSPPPPRPARQAPGKRLDKYVNNSEGGRRELQNRTHAQFAMAREASPSSEQAFFDSSSAFLSTASTATSWRRLRLRFFVLCRVDGLSLFSRGGAVSRAWWPR